MKDTVIACCIIRVNKMKRVKLFIFSFLLILLVACKDNNANNQDDNGFDAVIEMIDIPTEIYEDLELQDSLLYNGKRYDLTYEMDDDSLTSDGEINPDLDNDTIVNIVVSISDGSEIKKIEYKDHKVMSMKNIVSNAISKVDIPLIVNKDLSFLSSIGNVRVRWSTSNADVIGRNGACSYVSSDTNVSITATFSIKNDFDVSYSTSEVFGVLVRRWDPETRYEKVMDRIVVPDTAIYDINLISKLDYDVDCIWESSDEETISKIGRVNRSDSDKEVTLKLTMCCSDSSEKKELTYNVKVLKYETREGEMNFNKHVLINRANELNTDKMNNLKYNGEKIVLEDNALIGTYESEVYNTLEFRRVVGSFSCITSEKATCELAISIKVDGEWSKYFSYGEFGLGRNNLYYNQTDTKSYMDTDMIEPKSGYRGNGVKYRITLRRDSLSTKSPELSLVALALFIVDYNYVVDTSNLPNSVDWDLPKLYQHDVPGIGGVICSATTTTMLLKFAGYDFSDKGYEYEHQYMANMVADRGHNNPTYGNWSYNMMAAGAFGINAYVGKMYSWDEIRYYLANNGPIGVSIGGNFGIYSTDGHLLVLRGYRIENGETTVICNDPNVKGVYYEVSLEIFLRCWGSVVYIMEFDNIPNRIKDIY